MKKNFHKHTTLNISLLYWQVEIFSVFEDLRTRMYLVGVNFSDFLMQLQPFWKH